VQAAFSAKPLQLLALLSFGALVLRTARQAHQGAPRRAPLHPLTLVQHAKSKKAWKNHKKSRFEILI
jgi:hypothetical protein